MIFVFLVARKKKPLSKFFKKNYLAIEIVIIVLLLIGGIFFLTKGIWREQEQHEQKVQKIPLKTISEVSTVTDDCRVTEDPKTIVGGSMEPLLKNGSKIVLLSNFYHCGGTPEIGDIVAYNYGGNELPIIKKIAARDSDTVEFRNGFLYINDAELLNSAGKKYNFSLAERKMIALYIKENKIPKNSVLIFGDNVSTSDDSRKFGAVAISDLLGKFEE